MRVVNTFLQEEWRDAGDPPPLTRAKTLPTTPHCYEDDDADAEDEGFQSDLASCAVGSKQWRLDMVNRRLESEGVLEAELEREAARAVENYAHFHSMEIGSADIASVPMEEMGPIFVLLCLAAQVYEVGLQPRLVCLK